MVNLMFVLHCATFAGRHASAAGMHPRASFAFAVGAVTMPLCLR